MLIADNLFFSWLAVSNSRPSDELSLELKESYDNGALGAGVAGFLSNGAMVHMAAVDRTTFVYSALRFAHANTSKSLARTAVSTPPPNYSGDAYLNLTTGFQYFMPPAGACAYGGSAYRAGATAGDPFGDGDYMLAKSEAYLVERRVTKNSVQGVHDPIYFRQSLSSVDAGIKSIVACVDQSDEYTILFSGNPVAALTLLWAISASNCPGHRISDVLVNKKGISFYVRFFQKIKANHWTLNKTNPTQDFLLDVAHNPIRLLPTQSFCRINLFGETGSVTQLIGSEKSRVFSFVSGGARGTVGDLNRAGHTGTIYRLLLASSGASSELLLNEIARSYSPMPPDGTKIHYQVLVEIMKNFTPKAIVFADMNIAAMATNIHRYLFYLQSIMVPEVDVCMSPPGVGVRDVSIKSWEMMEEADLMVKNATAKRLAGWERYAEIVQRGHGFDKSDLEGMMKLYTLAIHRDAKESGRALDNRAAFLPPWDWPHSKISRHALWLFENYGVIPRSKLYQVINVASLTPSFVLNSAMSAIRGINTWINT